MSTDAVIVSAARTAIGKAPRGALRNTRPDDMGAAVIREAVRRAEGLDPAMIDDVILGCAMPEGASGMNMARVATLRAGLPDSVPAQTVNRFCSSGVQTIALASANIQAGICDVVVAGGAESMSMVPMRGHRFEPNPWMVECQPEVYMGMGLTAEQVADKYNVTREDQDAFAYRSHMNAINAIQSGKFVDEIVPLEVEYEYLDDDGQVQRQTSVFKVDEGPRKDTSVEALAKLRPVFKEGGSVTAGNSSQTSDGAGAVVIMSAEKAKELGLTPLARFVTFAVGGVPPEIMGIGPVVAIPKALKRAGLTINDIDLVELNEAFAAQALPVIRETGMDMDKVNVNGGAIALGHPLGASGAKLTVQILNEAKRRNARYIMVTMCIGGGQGAAIIYENMA
ncbi:MAG: acetyl-CoA C-acyltransferase [Anaerolineae bacterium]